jgi:hypothetical protein
MKTFGGHKSYSANTNYTSYYVHIIFGIQEGTSQVNLLLTVRCHIFEETLFLTIHMDAAKNLFRFKCLKGLVTFFGNSAFESFSKLPTDSNP